MSQAGLERWDLTEFMRMPAAKGEYGSDTYWSSGFGGHLGGLRAFTDPARVKILHADGDHDYSGSCYAVLVVQNEEEERWVLWRDSYGSCSGCDGLEETGIQDAHKTIKGTLQEGNTRQFTSAKEAAEYLKNTEDYLWLGCPRDIVEKAELAALAKVVGSGGQE
jgi:hypothetical protein